MKQNLHSTTIFSLGLHILTKNVQKPPVFYVDVVKNAELWPPVHQNGSKGTFWEYPFFEFCGYFLEKNLGI